MGRGREVTTASFLGIDLAPWAGSADISTSSPAPGPVGGTLRTTTTAPEDSRAQGELAGCSVAADMFGRLNRHFQPVRGKRFPE